MEEMDGSEMLNFEGSGCMGVSGKWKTEGMSVYWE